MSKPLSAAVLVFVVLSAAALLSFPAVLDRFSGDYSRLAPTSDSSAAPVLKIAVANAFKGPNAASGVAMLRGAQLLVDRVNAGGGINGRLVELVPMDDGRNADGARQVAKTIGTGNDILAVIGHGTSTASLAAGGLYRRHQIPAVTPTSTNPQVTLSNPWYFRTVFNDNLQGRILAHYLRSILGYPSVAVVHLSDAYSAGLAETFSAAAQSIGLTIKSNILLAEKPSDAELDRVAGRIAADGAQSILLVLRPAQAEPLVGALKQRGVSAQMIGTDSLALAGFVTEQSEDEPTRPPHFTDGMYIAMPFIPDTATAAAREFLQDYTKRYGEQPIWTAIYAYDSALVLVEALRRLQIEPSNTVVTTVRTAIRDQLAAMNTPAQGTLGLMGPIYFDEHGDAARSVYVGRTERRHIAPAAQQLQIFEANGNATTRETDENVIDLGTALLQVTQVVHTGIQINKFTDLDEAANTFAADFELWFRYTGTFDAAGIVFPDAVAPIVLSTPLREHVVDGQNYRAFRVKAEFHYHTSHENLTDGDENLVIRFHHPNRDRARLVFVTDGQGMGLNTSPWANRLREEDVLSSDTGWVIDSGTVFQETLHRSTLGDPRFPLSAFLPYSEFRARITVHKGEVSFKRQREKLLPERDWLPLLICLSLLFVVTWLPILRHHHPISTVLVRLVLGVLLLYAGERLFVDRFAERLEIYQLKSIFLGVEILWWLVPAIALIALLPHLVWHPIERSTGYRISSIARSFTNLAIMLVAVSCVLAFVFDQSLITLGVASGTLTVVLGFALQSLILDAFSGLMLNLERPFSIGDWIKLGDDEEATCGRVDEMNWRTTRLWTRDNNVIVIPNSAICTATLVNYSVPSRPSRLGTRLLIDFPVPIKRVREVLERGASDAVGKHGILAEPKPYIAIDSMDDYGYAYSIYIHYDVSQVSEENARTHLVECIQLRLDQAGIELALPPEKQRYEGKPRDTRALSGVAPTAEHLASQTTS